MRIIFTSMPAESHIGPTFPLARALRQTGHEVTYVTGLDAVDYVRAARFDVVAGGLNTTAYRQGYRQRAAELVGLTPEQRLEHAYVHGAIGLAAPAMVADLLPIAERLQPDVIISNHGEWAGELVSSVTGARHMLHGFGAPKADQFGQRLVPALDSLYAALGVPAVTQQQRARDVYLDIWPAGLEPEHTTWWYPNVWPMRPAHVLPRSSATPPRPSVLAGLPYERTIYVTAGTTYNTRAASMFETILEALRDEPVNVVATVGPDGDTTVFDPLPAHIRVEKFVPQDTMLPYCAAVICHAGAGTVLGALAHGVPLLVMMLQVAADHYEVASQVVSSGAGLSLPEDGLTVVGVREALTQLLLNPDHKVAADEIGRQLASMPSPVEVADALVSNA